MWKIPSLIVLVFSVIMFASAAKAAPPVCGDRAKVIDRLSAKYSEEPVAIGITANGGVIEVLKAPDGATWTILFTYPSGPCCLVASGEAWQDLEARLKGPQA